MNKDPWDQLTLNPRKKKEHIPEDWDDEDIEEAPMDTSTLDTANKIVWDEANSKETVYGIAVASSSSASNTIAAAANAAFSAQPKRVILKRPAGSSPPTSNPSTESTQQKSLEDRQASYQAAREKIFGSSTADTSSQGPIPTFTSIANKELEAPLSKWRDPFGPKIGPDGKVTRGFIAKREPGVGSPAPQSLPESNDLLTS
ncbi:hypothetical protein FRC02_009157 [Tulasnella sp. 418]|nr:hypothetical protein FRC02_009157 [Tulasnella sp. 418]